MTNQEIFNQKMTALADAINEKANTTGKKNLDELKEAVDSINQPVLPLTSVKNTKWLLPASFNGSNGGNLPPNFMRLAFTFYVGNTPYAGAGWLTSMQTWSGSWGFYYVGTNKALSTYNYYSGGYGGNIEAVPAITNREIYIAGGPDETSASLINWLTKNATLLY